ncbi:MAG TPA: hypothetical protein VFA34_01680 [Actinomycetota bacterium]|jgi:hypothetical protein|nr:hypothetical protein [Actinomycetota bacterium]
MRRLGAVLFVLLSVSCSGRSKGVVQIEGPSFEPKRIAIRTLEPGPSPSPSPTPSPTPLATPTPLPIGPPRSATITSAAGTQKGNVSSFCWSDQVGAPAKCYSHEQKRQAKGLVVHKGEKVLLRIDAQIAPDDESVRPFQHSRSGYPSQRIDPALETELTVDLPEGEWSMDLCATWHGRGQPICWLFALSVAP